MPRISKTILPRIRRSLRERGLATSLFRSVLLPVHLVRELRAARRLRGGGNLSAFDSEHGVDTEGEMDGWTYLSDLKISSSNWIDGTDYAAIEPERFHRLLGSLNIPFEETAFIDFGSGKGRALLLASEFSFRQIIGLEFAPELHAIAIENLGRYRSHAQKCENIASVNVDFLDFALPAGPLLLYFFDPCHLRVFKRVIERIGQSLARDPRPLTLAYVAPRRETEEFLATVSFLREVSRSDELNFIVYGAVRS
jgi:SAM-dependent methyltransferase